MSFQQDFSSCDSPDARAVQRSREQFLAGKEDGLTGVRPIVLESWRRCRQSGLDPGLKKVPTVLSRDEVHRLREENDLYRAAHSTLHFLAEVLAGSNSAVLLADDRCRSLDITGNPRVLAQAEQINGMLGAEWREEQVGTDALAVSHSLDTPVQIHWAEHYCELGHKWAGNSAPIHHPFTTEVVGTISIYGYDGIAHSRALPLVTQAAAMIERQLYQNALVRQLSLFEHYHSQQNRLPHNTLFCLDSNGTILLASPNAANLLQIGSEEMVGRLLAQLPGVSLPEPFLPDCDGPHELLLHTEMSGALHATLTPVRQDNRLAGFVASLQVKSTPAKNLPPASTWRAAYTFTDIIGHSAQLQACLAEADKIAQRDFPVLISGESGTGKELFAHAMHQASPRREGPFVPLSCGGMNEELLGAELFGYEEGAFTGAVRGGRSGKLELADRGTLFLDEVEDMSPRMQAHLLRVLEEKRVTRIGAEKPRRIDVRVIAATNADLEARATQEKFRRDLYYRLAVLPLSLPPLRERPGDIPILVQHLMASQALGKEVSPQALARLAAYCWPGNVRQLRNVLLQAADRTDRELITVAALPGVVCGMDCRSVRCPFAASKEETRPERDGLPLQQAERELVLQTLRECHGNISRAAARLGLHRVTLYRKMAKHGIQTDRVYR